MSLDIAFSHELFAWTNVAALAAWLSVASINNTSTFNELMGAVGRTMGMAALDEEPSVPARLTLRAVRAPYAHQAAVLCIVVLQTLASLALWVGPSLRRLAGDPFSALAWSNVGLVLAVVLCARHACRRIVVRLVDTRGPAATHSLEIVLLWMMTVFVLIHRLPV